MLDYSVYRWNDRMGTGDANDLQFLICIVYIKSGAGVPYGDVVNVINEVRRIGVDKIGLVADKKSNARPSA